MIRNIVTVPGQLSPFYLEKSLEVLREESTTKQILELNRCFPPLNAQDPIIDIDTNQPVQKIITQVRDRIPLLSSGNNDENYATAQKLFVSPLAVLISKVIDNALRIGMWAVCYFAHIFASIKKCFWIDPYRIMSDFGKLIKEVLSGDLSLEQAANYLKFRAITYVPPSENNDLPCAPQPGSVSKGVEKKKSGKKGKGGKGPNSQSVPAQGQNVGQTHKP